MSAITRNFLQPTRSASPTGHWADSDGNVWRRMHGRIEHYDFGDHDWAPSTFASARELKQEPGVRSIGANEAARLTGEAK